MPKKDTYVQIRHITYAPSKFPDLQQQYQQLLVWRMYYTGSWFIAQLTVQKYNYMNPDITDETAGTMLKRKCEWKWFIKIFNYKHYFYGKKQKSVFYDNKS